MTTKILILLSTMNNFQKLESFIKRTIRLLLLVSVTGLAACSTMQATDTGFLKNQSEMTTSNDGSTAYYRSATPIDPHQVRALSVEWAMPMDAEFSSIEKTQLMSILKAAISKETEALPNIVGGHPVIIRAVITRVKSVSPVLNVVAAVLLTVPLDRGGAAVEMEILDAETRQPLASMSHAYFAPLSEFKARFIRLAPAKFALQAAAEKFATLLRVAN